MTGDFAGSPGFADDQLKIAPFCVTKQVLDVTRQPILQAAVGLLGIGFKYRGQGVHKFFLHVFPPSVAAKRLVVSFNRNPNTGNAGHAACAQAHRMSLVVCTMQAFAGEMP